MKRDIKVNYGTIDSIVQELERYRSALENMESTIININNKLESENSGDAVSALRIKYSDMKSQIDSCKEEITDLHDIFSNYSNDMTSIIKPKNHEAMMRVSRNDIYWNMETLISFCCNVGMTRRNAAVFKSFPSAFASDEEKAAERRNGDKLDDLHNSIGYHYNRLMEDVSDMRNLYDRKIIPYENMDDTYKTKAKSIYSKYTNFFEDLHTKLNSFGVGTINLVKGIGGSILGFIGDVWNLVKGVFVYAGAAIGIACTAVFGDAPDCLKECKSKAAKYNETISAIIHDPFLIVEGLSQGVNDAYEEKGICYVTGYVVGEVAQLIILKKAGDKIKGVKGADTAVDAEKMALNSLDDAAKFEKKFVVEGAAEAVKKNLKNKISNIRSEMPNTNLSKRGNMAAAEVDIDGIKREFVAHSKINSVESKGSNVSDFSYLKPENERLFTSYVVDKFPRYHDTEAKILEDIAGQIKDPNILGTINLYSELSCCQSCSNIILEFRRKFPNIKLNIYVE